MSLEEFIKVDDVWYRHTKADSYEIFEAVTPVLGIKTDKPTIAANGLDTATVTAEVHPDLTELTFYHTDTGEAISTVPVDPATHKATLQVTATTPGVIKIQAGEPTITRLNEVVITAQ
jgi:hypothetical protein